MLRAVLGVSIGWIGLSMVNDGLPALLFPYLVMGGGSSTATTVGLVTLVAIGLAATVQPFAGAWSDRVGRIPVMAAGTATALAGLALLVAPGTAMLGTVVALGGVSIAQAGYQPLLPDRIGPEWRGRAGGLKGAFDVAGALLGFVVLAALLGAGQPQLAAIAMGGVLVAGLVAGGVIAKRLPPGPETAAVRPLDLGDRPTLVPVVVARFLFLLGIFVVGRFLLLFVSETMGLGPQAAGGEAGLALALLALVTVLASVPSGWLADRLGRRPLMVAGGLLGAAGIGLLPAAGTIEQVLAFGGLMALGSAAFGSASWAMLSDLASTPDAGRLLGLANIGTAAAAAGAGAFGLLIDASGYGVAFGLAAGCSLAGAVIAWRLGESLRGRDALVREAEATG